MSFIALGLGLVALVLLVALVRTTGNTRIAKAQAEVREEELIEELRVIVHELSEHHRKSVQQKDCRITVLEHEIRTTNIEYLNLSDDFTRVVMEKLDLQEGLALTWSHLGRYISELEAQLAVARAKTVRKPKRPKQALPDEPIELVPTDVRPSLSLVKAN